MALKDIPDDNSNWADLNEFIYRNYLSVGYMGRHRFEHRDLLWEKVSHESIERRDILNLRRSGWDIEFKGGDLILGRNPDAVCNFNLKKNTS